MTSPRNDIERTDQRETSRRGFLGHSAAATAGLALATGLHAAEPKADRQPLHLGIIGCGGIMGHHMKGLVQRREAVTIGWLCDVDPRQIDRVAGLMEGFQQATPRRTDDFEAVLDDPRIDAVIIATPHHWHAPMTLRAIAAGKDVYIEKPVSHVFAEGPLVMEAASRAGRVVQQGSQMRSSPVTARAGKLLREGLIGEIKVARAWTVEPRTSQPPVADSTPPDGVNYDRWLGPAPVRPFNKLRFHRTWRLFQDYGNGEIGDDGIHDIDMARWGLGVEELPTQITARGSRKMLKGHASEYPDNLNVTWEFPDGRLMVYENIPFSNYGMHGWDNGNVFYGTEGYMIFSRRGAFNTYLGRRRTPGPTEGSELRGQRGYAEHMADFFNCVRERRLETVADPETAHLSCALVHLGEIAYRTRGRVDFDSAAGKFVDCPEADQLLTKDYRAPWDLDVQG